MVTVLALAMTESVTRRYMLPVPFAIFAVFAITNGEVISPVNPSVEPE